METEVVLAEPRPSPADELAAFAAGRSFGTIMADPPWQFVNRTGKVAPEHRRLSRYRTMSLDEIMGLPVARLAAPVAHLYLWVPNALLPEGLGVMAAWGFTYKSNLVWHKVRKDGGSDGRGVGFYFRNVTELLVRHPWPECAHAGAGAAAGEPLLHAQARAQPQAGRAVRHHRGLLARPLPRAVRARGPRRAGRPGVTRRSRVYQPTWRTYVHHSQPNPRAMSRQVSSTTTCWLAASWRSRADWCDGT